MDSHNRVPLFITRFSLSACTAIGVQTVRLLGPNRDWLHFHWSSGCLSRIDRRSIRLENRIVSRYSFLQNATCMRLWDRLGISTWSGCELRPHVANRLTAKYRDRISSVYLSPLNEGDARRCLHLANLVGAPFVLHLWDVLDGDLTQGALRELIDRAENVFCLSEPMLRDVSGLRADAALLSFSRDVSPFAASPRQQGPLKVVFHGNVSAYPEGLNDLDKAIALLENRGLQVEVTYPGSPKIMSQANTTIKRRVKVRGFFATQDHLDRELSRAHIAFLPGPKRSPQADLRSRYSIPSRILDYLAVGLPIVGTVHQESATGGFVRTLGLNGTTTCVSPEEIAQHLLRLAQPGNWATESARSRDAFACLQKQEAPAVTLHRAMARIRRADSLTDPSPLPFLRLSVQKSR